MSHWNFNVQEFIDGIACSVAIVGVDSVSAVIALACNAGFFDIVGREQIDSPFPLETVFPSYARRVMRSKIQECIQTGIAQELERAFDLRDGTHWWRMSLKPFHFGDGDNAISGLLITGLDITAKVDVQQKLEASTSRFRSVVDAAYDVIVTIDQEHRITLFNRAAENLLGYNRMDVIGQPLEMLIPQDHRQRHMGYVQRFANSPLQSREMNDRSRIYVDHCDGSRIPVEIAISKIKVESGSEFTAVIRDITDRVHLLDLLTKQAATDVLIGLPNRREFTARAMDLMRADKPFSVLALDVDHFKRVNDGFGHDVGDEALRLLASVGVSTVWHRDVFARIGGEEFAAALPDTDSRQALAMAERLRAIFDQQAYDHSWKLGQAVSFTVSIGVATRTASDDDLDSVLKRSDLALYRAKKREETASSRDELAAGVALFASTA